jgi:hypothetical protein
MNTERSAGTSMSRRSLRAGALAGTGLPEPVEATWAVNG